MPMTSPKGGESGLSRTVSHSTGYPGSSGYREHCMSVKYMRQAGTTPSRSRA